MKAANAGLQALSVFAILFLMGFGIVVYAVPETASSSSSSTGSSNSQAPPPTAAGGSLSYSLVPLPDYLSQPVPANYPFQEGGALIVIYGDTLEVTTSFIGAPGTTFVNVLQTHQANMTVGTVTTTSTGSGVFHGNLTLAPGSYQVGLLLFVYGQSSAPVAVSNPRYLDLTLYSTTTTTSTTTTSSSTHSESSSTSSTRTSTTSSSSQTSSASSTSSGTTTALRFAPIAASAIPSGYSYGEGSGGYALTGVTEASIEFSLAFSGQVPDARFGIVLSVNGSARTLGDYSTSTIGAGSFVGSSYLGPGTFVLGLTVEDLSSFAAATPVLVSVPASFVVVGYGLSTTSMTSTSSTQSSTTTSSTRASTTSSSSQTSSTSSGATTALRFAPIAASAIPSGYSYGEGSGGYALTGVTEASLYFSLAFSGQVPEARFAVVLTVNGSARTLGDYMTTTIGAGSFVGSSYLGPGTFVLGLTVEDLSSFAAATPVLVSVPASFVVVGYGLSTTSTTSSTSTSSSRTGSTTSATSTSVTGITVPQGPDWVFRLEAASVPNVPSGYRFASSGTVIVTLDTEYSLLYAEIGFQGANPTTSYIADLTINGTSMNLGSLTTNKDGGAELKSSLEVSPGTYVIGIQVYDISDIAEFGASGPVLVMVSNPASQVAVFPSPNGVTSSSSSTTASSTTVTQTTVSTVTETVTTIKAGTSVQAQIQNALNNLTIPASVQLTPLVSTTSVYDSRFSLSVGQVAGNGIVVAISGENVTGSRVLLINMSKTAPLALYPALNVTLDGVPVAEAASAVQVLNPTPTNPPYYVLVATSDSIQLLVSIPHFSVHLIQVSGVIVHTIETALSLDGPLLVASIAVITLAFLGAYASRKRYFLL